MTIKSGLDLKTRFVWEKKKNIKKVKYHLFWSFRKAPLLPILKWFLFENKWFFKIKATKNFGYKILNWITEATNLYLGCIKWEKSPKKLLLFIMGQVYHNGSHHLPS